MSSPTPPIRLERCRSANLPDSALRARHRCAHQPSLAACSSAHLPQIIRPHLPSSCAWISAVVFYSSRRHVIKTTVAVFCLTSPSSTASSSLYCRQASLPSIRRQHVERPSIHRHYQLHHSRSDSASRHFCFPVPTRTLSFD